MDMVFTASMIKTECKDSTWENTSLATQCCTRQIFAVEWGYLLSVLVARA